MKKIMFSMAALFIIAASVAFTVPHKKDPVIKTFRYNETNNTHVKDGVSPYWVETTSSVSCDSEEPTLPCTVTIPIGDGGYANLDAFLDQFADAEEMLLDPNVTGKDE